MKLTSVIVVSVLPACLAQDGNVAAPGLRFSIEQAIANSLASEAFVSELEDQANPPQKPKEPSLGELGFPNAATQPNPQEQARLDRRTRMLRMHQRLGLITIAPLVATVITGGFAGGRQTSSSMRDLHAALGGVSGGLYFATAYYAIFAPGISGVQTRGPIRLHKALAWIHGPGMVLTPILGILAFDQKSKGERIHGLASAHGPVGVVTAAAFGLAVFSVSFKF